MLFTRLLLLAEITVFASSVLASDILSDAAQKYRTQKLYKLALPLCEQLVNEQPEDVQALCNLASCLLRTRQTKNAEVILHKALSLNPQSAPASYLLAVIHSKNSAFAAALSCIETAITTDPNHEGYQLFKIKLLVLNERISEAKILLSTIGNDSPQRAAEQAELSEVLGNSAEAKRQYLDLTQKAPDDLGLRFEYARLVVHAEAIDVVEARRALSFIEEVVVKSDSTPLEIAPDCLLFFVLASAHAGLGEFELAKAFQAKAIEMYDTRCSVPNIEFERALVSFANAKRYIPAKAK